MSALVKLESLSNLLEALHTQLACRVREQYLISLIKKNYKVFSRDAFLRAVAVEFRVSKKNKPSVLANIFLLKCHTQAQVECILLLKNFCISVG